jgi:uncharacterized protein (TIGR02757 family)
MKEASPRPLSGASPPTREALEKLYRKWNRPEFIHPDPLEFVLRFNSPADQEVAGVLASSLAFGRVGHILKSLEEVFRIFPDPAADIGRMSSEDLKYALRSFRHRWTSGREVADLLSGVKRLRDDHGSLEGFFTAGVRSDQPDVVSPLAAFVAGLRKASGNECPGLLPCPTRGSACKRLMLYLRWMVRKDDVDPGPWKRVSPSMLVVPMDTHMYRVSRALGLTARRQADLKCALEVTGFFRSMVPEDPVRYDFALTRPGIRKEVEKQADSRLDKA